MARHKHETEEEHPRNPVQEAANSGISAGLAKISGANPRFSSRQEDYLKSYLNNELVNKYYNIAVEKLKDKNGQINLNQLSLVMAQHTIKGDFFDKKVKYEILKGKGLEGKITRSNKELSDAIDTANKLYVTALSQGYQNDPEIKQVLSYAGNIRNIGFYLNAADALYEKGFMSQKEYDKTTKDFTKKAKEGMKYINNHIKEKSLASYVQKATVFMMAFLGIFVILSTTSITGAAIGSPSKTLLSSLPAVLWGILVLAAAFYLYSKIAKKKIKHKKKKR
ncbi:MAG: hypothetical protein ACP5OG_03225 [Candidatus Nanoarchaeia archaeon]